MVGAELLSEYVAGVGFVVGLGVSQTPSAQMKLTQSPLMLQVAPASHGQHEPPQSVLDSSPSRSPLTSGKEWGSWWGAQTARESAWEWGQA